MSHWDKRWLYQRRWGSCSRSHTLSNFENHSTKRTLSLIVTCRPHLPNFERTYPPHSTKLRLPKSGAGYPALGALGARADPASAPSALTALTHGILSQGNRPPGLYARFELSCVSHLVGGWRGENIGWIGNRWWKDEKLLSSSIHLS